MRAHILKSHQNSSIAVCTMLYNEPNESPVSMGMKEPSFNDLWTARTQALTVMHLNWSNLYQTHPKEYSKRVRKENHVQDLSGWRKKPCVELSEHVEPPGFECAEKDESAHG